MSKVKNILGLFFLIDIATIVCRNNNDVMQSFTNKKQSELYRSDIGLLLHEISLLKYDTILFFEIKASLGKPLQKLPDDNTRIIQK
jgi:hypothetical protein